MADNQHVERYFALSLSVECFPNNIFLCLRVPRAFLYNFYSYCLMLKRILNETMALNRGQNPPRSCLVAN